MPLLTFVRWQTGFIVRLCSPPPYVGRLRSELNACALPTVESHDIIELAPQKLKHWGAQGQSQTLLMLARLLCCHQCFKGAQRIDVHAGSPFGRGSVQYRRNRRRKSGSCHQVAPVKICLPRTKSKRHSAAALPRAGATDCAQLGSARFECGPLLPLSAPRPLFGRGPSVGVCTGLVFIRYPRFGA